MRAVSPDTTLVILLGASSWPHANLDGGPVFSNSAHDLRGYFLDHEGFGLPESNLLDLFDSKASPSEVLVQLGDFLTERRGQASYHDLILYYVGHGSFHGNSDDYYLALQSSRVGREHITSLRVEDLASEVRSQSRHMRRFVLFDCCYAGKAAAIFQSNQNQRGARKARDAFRSGTLVYCSSNKDDPSLAPNITRNTMFTGSLLKALKQGKGEFPAKLTMADVDYLVWQNIHHTFDETYAVRPELHSPDQKDGDLRKLPLFPNRALIKTTISGKKIKPTGKLMVASSLGGVLSINGQEIAPLEPEEYFQTDPIPVGEYRVSFEQAGKNPITEILTVGSDQTLKTMLGPKKKEAPMVLPPARQSKPAKKQSNQWLTANRFAYMVTILVFAAIFWWKLSEGGLADNPITDPQKVATGEPRKQNADGRKSTGDSEKIPSEPDGEQKVVLLETEKENPEKKSAGAGTELQNPGTRTNETKSSAPKKQDPKKDANTLKAGITKVFNEGGVEIPMVWCPPGSYQMGSPGSEIDRSPIETQHKVRLRKGFWMAQTEVTQALWEEVMSENPSKFKGGNLPVEKVSWYDVQKFITRLNKKIGKQVYRLPTEAEWEYACRAGTSTSFYTGENITTDQANYNGENPYAGFAKGEYRGKTTPVKTFSPNAWGLYDMHGNVWEWCQDRYGKYDQGEQLDPGGPKEGATRVVRGGSWDSVGRHCRSAYRGRPMPEVRDGYLGFRLVRGHEH